MRTVTSIYFYFVFITIVFCACNSSIKKDQNTQIFSEYLKNQFGSEIPDENHYYILIPKTGCQGAIFTTLTVAGTASDADSAKITVISANETTASNILSDKWQTWKDNSGELDRLNLNISNVTLIVTKNNAVSLIKSSAQCDSDMGRQILNLLPQKTAPNK